MDTVKNPQSQIACNAEGDELLCRYCRTKDGELRNRIFEKYMNLATIIAKKYMNKGVEYEDLFQVASIGLLLAIDRFDCARGVKFSTFATPTIMGEIRKYFRDRGFIIKLPRRLYEIFHKAERIRHFREQRGESMLTVNEMAKALSVADEDVVQSLKFADIINMRSLEETVYNDNDTALSQIIGVEEDSFLLVENRDFLCDCLRRLDPNEKMLVFLRYYKNKTQKQVAEELGMSQMNVSRLERKVLGKLKSMYIKN